MSATNYHWTPSFPRFCVDLNGDGRADVIGIGADGLWSAVNMGEAGYSTPAFQIAAFEANAGWRVGDHPRFALDLTGDGRADLIGFGDHGVWTALGNGDGSFGPAQLVLDEMCFSKGWSAEFPRYVVDLTGAGTPSLVGFGRDGIWTALSNGNGTFQPAQLVSGDLAYNTGWRVANHPRFLVDITGDKRADIVGFGDDGIWIALGTGDGTFQPARYVLSNFGYNQGWRVESHLRILADLTGNGCADMIGFGNDGVWTACATGDGGFQAERFVLADMGANHGWTCEKNPRFLLDLTGDGRADIVGFGDAGVWTALGNGDGTFQPAQFVLADFGVEQGWSGDSHPRYLADFDGDGKPDIIGFGDAGVWVARGNGDGTFQAPQFVLADFGRASNVDTVLRREVIRDHRPHSDIKHIFVLMLENRSYDHMLGFANLSGIDAATGTPTVADGLTGSEFNTYQGQKFPVVSGAPDVTVAPGHGFTDAREQLCGPFANYPDISSTGFVYSLAKSGYGDRGSEIMRCFDPDHLPVLTTLAREFAVCDRWFSSMPGPTEPNRYFLHAATSGRFDESPTPKELIEASTNHWGGMEFDGGTIFDALDRADVKYRIYAGDHFPVAGELKGVSNTFDVREFHELADDLKDENFDASFVHIEPKYFDGISDTADADFGNGNSQHPSGSVAAGERLIKATYEAIRNSPVWESSLLIITYDEHGGFYDHVSPPAADPTGSTGRKHGFKFDQLGARVPAVIVSPRIPKSTVEHRLLEHSSVIKTVCDQFDVPTLQHCRNLTAICGVGHLAHLSEPRTDTPAILPSVVVSDVSAPSKPLRAVTRRRVVRHGTFELPKHAFEVAEAAADPADSMYAMSVRIAAMREIALEPGRKDEILARTNQIQTASEAATYLREVESKLMHAP